MCCSHHCTRSWCGGAGACCCMCVQVACSMDRGLGPTPCVMCGSASHTVRPCSRLAWALVVPSCWSRASIQYITGSRCIAKEGSTTWAAALPKDGEAAHARGASCGGAIPWCAQASRRAISVCLTNHVRPAGYAVCSLGVGVLSHGTVLQSSWSDDVMVVQQHACHMVQQHCCATEVCHLAFPGRILPFQLLLNIHCGRGMAVECLLVGLLLYIPGNPACVRY